MSRHRARTHSFSRRYGPRHALIRGLVSSLVEHGRIYTTIAKAKELRRHVEKAITLGKSGSVHARRLLISRLANAKTAAVIVDDLSKRFKDRPGGYTRIVKAGTRPGDKADMAYIEFLDRKKSAESEGKATDTKVAAAGEKASKATKKSAAKKKAKDVSAKKKTGRRLQSKARRK